MTSAQRKRLIEDRAVEEGKCLLLHKTTVRGVASKFSVSKTTVHNDLTRVLPEVDPSLAEACAKLMQINLSLRSVRGGEVTRRKYEGR